MALITIAAMLDHQKDCLDIIADTTGNFIVKILTVHGQFIKTIRETFQSEGHTVSVHLGDLSKGNYVANVFKDNSFLSSFHFNKD